MRKSETVSEESCGHEGDGRIYIHLSLSLSSVNIIYLNKLKSPSSAPLRRAFSRCSVASFSRTCRVSSPQCNPRPVSRIPTYQNRPDRSRSTPSFHDSPDSLLYEYFISRKTRPDAAQTLFSIYVYSRQKTRPFPHGDSLLFKSIPKLNGL